MLRSRSHNHNAGMATSGWCPLLPQARLVTNLEHLNVEEERGDGGSGEAWLGKRARTGGRGWLVYPWLLMGLVLMGIGRCWRGSSHPGQILWWTLQHHDAAAAASHVLPGARARLSNVSA